MVNYKTCCVPHCKDETSKVYSLPVKDHNLLEQWLKLMGIPELSSKNLRTKGICAQHFDASCFISNSDDTLKDDAMPSLKLPTLQAEDDTLELSCTEEPSAVEELLIVPNITEDSISTSSNEPDEDIAEDGEHSNRDTVTKVVKQDSFNNTTLESVRTRNKRRKLTSYEKLEIIKEVEANPNLSKRALADRFKIASSSLHGILQQKQALLERAVNCGPYAMNMKRLKTSPYDKIDKELIQWIEGMKSENVQVTTNMLKRKAFDISVEMNIANFRASNGWLQRFKIRQGIIFGKDGVDMYRANKHTMMMSNVLPTLADGYNSKNIFSIGILTLAYNLRPEDCLGSKDIDKINIILCCNINGTEKLPPLVIGNETREVCLENMFTLPCQYINKSATSHNEIIGYLRQLDESLQQKSRDILLFLEKKYEEITPRFTNVKTSYVLKDVNPLSYKIFYLFKLNYRRALIRKLLAYKEINEELQFDLFQALNLISSAWTNLDPALIKESFNKAGFNLQEATADPNVNEDYADDDWELVRGDLNISFEEYVRYDDAFKFGEDENRVVLKKEEKIIPCLGEAIAGFETFRRYLCSSEIDEETMRNVNSIEWKLLFALFNENQ